MRRRRFVAAVAALAVTRWEEAGYDPNDFDGWEPTKAGSYTTGSFTPSLVVTSGEGPVGRWLVEDDALDDRSLEIRYDSGGVHLSLEGSSDDFRGGTLAELQPDQARQVAATLYQAAAELDARRDAGDV